MKLILILFTVVLSLLASVVPVIGTDVWFSQFIAVGMFGYLFIALKLFKMSKALGVLFAYSALSVVFVTHFNLLSFVVLMMVGVCGLIAVEVSKLNRNQRIYVYITLGVLLLIQVIYVFIQKMNLDPIFKLISNPKLSDTVGFSGSHNQYSLFVSILSSLFFENFWALGLVFVALIFSTSISGLIGCLVGLLFYYRTNKHIFLLWLGVVIICFVVFFFITKKGYETEFKERVGVWKLSIYQVISGKSTLELSKDVKQVVGCDPLFGYGLGSFFRISPYTQSAIINANSKGSHRYEHAHNDYVEIFFDLGYVGFGLFCIWLISFITLLQRCHWDHELNLLVSMFICISVCALSIYTIHTAYNGMLICVILGLIYGKIKECL